MICNVKIEFCANKLNHLKVMNNGISFKNLPKSVHFKQNFCQFFQLFNFRVDLSFLLAFKIYTVYTVWETFIFMPFDFF